MKLLSRVRLLATPWTAAHQAPLPMGFSRQEYWSGVPLPSPKIPQTARYCKKKKIIIFPGAPRKEHRPRLWPSENCVRSLTCRSLGEHLSMACGEGSPRKVLIGLFLLGTSLVVQWLRLHAPSAGGLGSIPGQGTRSHVLQVLVSCCNQDPAQSNK